MADISIEFNSIELLANEITKLQLEYDRMLKDLRILVNSMDGQWQGKAQLQFAEDYKTLKPKLEIINTLLAEYSKTLSDVVAREMELERDNSNLFSNVAYPTF